MFQAKFTCKFLIIILVAYSRCHAQDAMVVISKYKSKLYEEKGLKPIQSVKMILEINTPEGKLPATLRLVDNMAYKLEIQGKSMKAFEYVDLTNYKFFNSSTKTKLVVGGHTELHLRKLFLLEFYPFLNKRNEFQISEVHQDLDVTRATVEPTAEIKPMSENQSISSKLFVQKLPINEMYHVYFFDTRLMQIVKIETKYLGEDGQPKVDFINYKDYIRSPEGYFYPATFTTTFGEATVKSIKFNEPIHPSELNVNF